MKIVISNKDDADNARKWLSCLFRELNKQEKMAFRKLYTGFPSQIDENRLVNSGDYMIRVLKKYFSPRFKDFPI